MRLKSFLACLVLGTATCTPAVAEVSVAIGLPGISIGINMPVYPDFVRVPGYPVYYAPQVQANFFFYDGMYWAFASDHWYASLWYNGPWDMVDPYYVPYYMWRVPVRYYRRPPHYFRGWSGDAPPRWGDHWGNDWERQHEGWDRWNRASAPAPAPLPTYQRQYSGNRYPPASQQHPLHQQNYRYQPQEKVVRQRWYQQPTGQGAPAKQTAPAKHQQQAQPQHQQQAQPQHQQQAQPQHQQQAQPQHQQQAQPAGGAQQPHGNAEAAGKGDDKGKKEGQQQGSSPKH